MRTFPDIKQRIIDMADEQQKHLRESLKTRSGFCARKRAANRIPKHAIRLRDRVSRSQINRLAPVSSSKKRPHSSMLRDSAVASTSAARCFENTTAIRMSAADHVIRGPYYSSGSRGAGSLLIVASNIHLSRPVRHRFHAGPPLA
jgi:hypothetical protein